MNAAQPINIPGTRKSPEVFLAWDQDKLREAMLKKIKGPAPKPVVHEKTGKKRTVRDDIRSFLRTRRGTAEQIAAATGRNLSSVQIEVRGLCRDGAVVRVGVEPRAPGQFGPLRTIYAGAGK